jgi:SAM-dependent methyltransferase
MTDFNWEDHYKSGGKSGDPSDYAKSREWKHTIIARYCDIKNNSIIDIGCGDLQFWQGRRPAKYTGIDISPTIIAAHTEKYPERTFICASSDETLNISADMVMCFDMLWHIMDDNVYADTISNMKFYSKKYIIIYTWNSNPFNRGLLHRIFNAIVKFKRTHKLDLSITTDDGGYQKYRPFKKLAKEIFNGDFELIDEYTNDKWKFGSMYVFRKVVE